MHLLLRILGVQKAEYQRDRKWAQRSIMSRVPQLTDTSSPSTGLELLQYLDGVPAIVADAAAICRRKLFQGREVGRDAKNDVKALVDAAADELREILILDDENSFPGSRTRR